MLRLWIAGGRIECASPSARRCSSARGSDGHSSPSCPGGIKTPGEVLTTPRSSYSLPAPSQTNSACRRSREASRQPLTENKSYTNFSCLRALEKQGKFTQWCTFKTAAENELISCLGAAPCFCIDESFKTYSWVWSNFPSSGESLWMCQSCTWVALRTESNSGIVVLSNQKEMRHFLGKKKLCQSILAIDVNLLLTNKYYHVLLPCDI